MTMRNRHNRINMWTKNIHLRVIMISNKPVNLDAYNGPQIQFTSIYSSHSRAAQRQKQVHVELRANLLCYECLSSWQISSSFCVLTLYIGFLIPSDLGSVCFYYNAFRHIVALAPNVCLLIDRLGLILISPWQLLLLKYQQPATKWHSFQISLPLRAQICNWLSDNQFIFQEGSGSGSSVFVMPILNGCSVANLYNFHFQGLQGSFRKTLS